jgi:alkylation response protein AidB-like acyl-CoA dehydrogenase
MSTVDEGRDMERVGDQLVACARGLREQLIAEQATTEERATYSQEVHETLLEAGFYRMYVPRRYGGLEVDVPTFMRVGVELARGDMGAAWGACLSANHALQVASWFPEQTQDEVFGGGDFRAASVAAPTIRATPTHDGYRLEGAVAYCSGIPYSTYYMGQAMLPEPDADGTPRMALFVAPRSAFTQLDDWGDTLGLKGTGSHTIRFDGAELPAHYVIEDVNMVDFAVENGTPGLALHGNPMYCGRALVIFTLSLACTLVGGGFNALDEYRNWALDKPTPLPPFEPRFQNADFQRWYGGAFVKLQTAEAAMMRCAELHMEACRRNAAGTEALHVGRRCPPGRHRARGDGAVLGGRGAAPVSHHRGECHQERPALRATLPGPRHLGRAPQHAAARRVLASARRDRARGALPQPRRYLPARCHQPRADAPAALSVPGQRWSRARVV